MSGTLLTDFPTLDFVDSGAETFLDVELARKMGPVLHLGDLKL